MTYSFMANIRDLLAASGMWRPVPDNDWMAWSQSLANTAFAARGSSGLKSLPTEEIIVDLCLQAPTLQHVLSTAPAIRVLSTIPSTPYSLSTINPETSWLDYKCTLEVIPSDQVAELQVLPTQPVPFPGAGYGLSTPAGGAAGGAYATPATATPAGLSIWQGGLPTLSGDGGSYPAASAGPIGQYQNQAQGSTAAVVQLGLQVGQLTTQQSSMVFQNRAPATFHVMMSGNAVRAGYPILPPALLSVGNQSPVLINDEAAGHGYRQGLVANWLGVPIYAARWRFRYGLPGVPLGQIALPPNPAAIA
jgi:hypothetical protein